MSDKKSRQSIPSIHDEDVEWHEAMSDLLQAQFSIENQRLIKMINQHIAKKRSEFLKHRSNGLD